MWDIESCDCVKIFAPGPAEYIGEVKSVVSFKNLVVAVGWCKYETVKCADANWPMLSGMSLWQNLLSGSRYGLTL